MFKIGDSVRTNDDWNKINGKSPINGVVTDIEILCIRKTEKVYFDNGTVGSIFTNEKEKVTLLIVDGKHRMNESWFELD